MGSATTTATTTVPATGATPVLADAALSPSLATTDLSKEFGAAAKYTTHCGSKPFVTGRRRLWLVIREIVMESGYA